MLDNRVMDRFNIGMYKFKIHIIRLPLFSNIIMHVYNNFKYRQDKLLNIENIIKYTKTLFNCKNYQ